MCETRILMHTFNLNSISQMKKKIFSTLLMGVFTLASMSMFVSCKDYDDDINDLDAGQQELLSRLEALEGDVNTKYTDLSGKLTTAVDNANKALQGVEDATALIEEVRTTASEAGTAAANAQTTADGAQEAAEAAQATADEALETAKQALEAAGADESGKQALEKVADLEERVAALEALKETIPTLIEEAQKATKEELKKLNDQVAKYEAFFDNLFAMLTSVEFYGTFSGDQFNTTNLSRLNMTMLHGNVGENSVFGDNEAYTTAAPQVSYVKGADIKNPSGVIIRVNPVNANITGDNVSIKLINSLGHDMSAFVEATAEPFNQLITRAGAQNKSGLYKVNFQFVDGVDMDAFDDMLTDPESGDSVLFAIAINNTDTVQADRYVASTFDLTVDDEAFVPSTVLHFDVTGTNGKIEFANLKNRWNGVSAVDDANKVVTNGPTEKKWVASSQTVKTPATAITTNPANTEAEPDNNEEDRCDNGYVPVEVGVPFTVALDDQNGVIDHYYVVLDKDFASESAPSEWNAWTSYSYTGLQTMTDADETLNITINSASALGDHIGFRVFAVNRDGTLVDPDGRAFYVAVGNATTTTTVNVEVRAWVPADQQYVIVELPEDFKPVNCETANNGSAQRSEFDKDGVKSSTDAKINWRLLADDDDVSAVIGWADAKYLKIALENDMQDFLDDATFSFAIKGYETTNGAGTTQRVVNTIYVNVTKVMPTAELTNFSFKENQLVNGVYTCYLDATDWNAPVWNANYSETTQGEKNLWNFVTGLDNDPEAKDGNSTDFIFSFANAQYNATTKGYTDAKVVRTTTPQVYELSLPQALIDGETEHATQISRNYSNISYRFDAQANGNVAKSDYVVDLLTCNTVFACPISKTTYSWNQKNKKDVNWIEYDSQVGPNGLAANENIVDYIAASNSVDPELYTANKLFSINYYAKESGVTTVKAQLISNNTKKEDYFHVTVGAGGGFTFTPVSGATNPVADVASTLVITAKDAYGHTYTYELPFTVKKRI